MRSIPIAAALSASLVSTGVAQATHNPCSMLTQTELSSALGVSPGAGQAIGTVGCQWAGSQIRVTVTFGDGSNFAIMKTPLPQVTKNAVTGIGDDAFTTTVGHLTTLSVKKGKDLFIVRVYGVPDQAKQIKIEKDLAMDLLARL